MDFFAADIANADGAAADVIMAPWYHDAMTPWCHGGKAMAQRRHDATAVPNAPNAPNASNAPPTVWIRMIMGQREGTVIKLVLV